MFDKRNKATIKSKEKHMRILLIEDDENIIRSLSLALKTAGYAVDTSVEGERGYFLAQTNNYDLILLDYNLPKLSGREIIEKLRSEKNNTPILMITVKSELENKIDIFSLGADDYLVKPFALSELMARIRAILRRPKTCLSNVLSIGDLELDTNLLILKKKGNQVKLSSKEFALLEFLLRNKGKTLTRTEIMDHVWDENADPFSNTIEVHINNLRRKIENKKQKFIYTFSNRGYKIDTQN